MDNRELDLLGAKILDLPILKSENEDEVEFVPGEGCYYNSPRYPAVVAWKASKRLSLVSNNCGTDMRDWSPSTDLNQAWEVAEAIGDNVRMEQERDGDPCATIWLGPSIRPVSACAKTRPLALMKAVQKAYEAKETGRAGGSIG